MSLNDISINNKRKRLNRYMKQIKLCRFRFSNMIKFARKQANLSTNLIKTKQKAYLVARYLWYLLS